MLKFFFNFLLIIFLVVTQISFLPALGYPVTSLNPILGTIIFITIILSYRIGLWLALILGFFLDLYSIFNFGTIAFSLVATTIFINFLFDRFFTNRSLYSLLILGLSGVLCYNFSLIILTYFFRLFQAPNLVIVLDTTYLHNLLWQIIFNLVLLAVIFMIVKFVSKQLKPYFIIK